MGHFLDALKALGTSISVTVRRPTTVEFPAAIRPRPERYRTSFALPDDEHGETACVGCMACERICPSGVIQVKPSAKRESPKTGKKRAYPDAFALDLSACLFCELCVQVCNNDALVMLSQPESPGFAREELVLTMERLVDNSRGRARAWATGSRLQEMQEGPPREKPAKAALAKKEEG